MVKTIINVEGMMCCNCERHMNEAIQKNFKVKEVTSSHENNQTEVISKASLDEAAVKQIVAEAGYEFKGMKEEALEKKKFGLFG